MKRKVRERLPKRIAGTFPSFLYKTLDELEGGGETDVGTARSVEDYREMRCKPLLILSDLELDEALLQQIGLPWIRVLALQRLRQEPLREGIVGLPGDLLRNALRLGPAVWGDLASDLEAIAAPLLPTLPRDEDHAPVHEAWSAYSAS